MKYLYRLFFSFLVILFLAAVGFFGWMQTTWGKNYFVSLLTHSAKKNSVTLEIGRFEGSFLSGTLYDVKMRLSSSASITIDQLRIQIALLPLLFDEILFEKLIATNIQYITAQPIKHVALPHFEQTGELPYNFHIKKLSLRNLQFLSVEPDLAINVDASGYIDKTKGIKQAKLTITKPHFENSFVKLQLKRSVLTDVVHIQYAISNQKKGFLSPFYAFPIDAAWTLVGKSQAPYQSYKALLISPTSKVKNIQLTADFKIDSLFDMSKISKSLLEKTKLSSTISIDPNQKTAELSCHGTSSTTELNCQIALTEWIKPNTGNIVLKSEIPLGEDQEPLSFALKGTVHQNVDHPLIDASFTLSDVNYHAINLQQTSGNLYAHLFGDHLVAEVLFSTLCQKMVFNGSVPLTKYYDQNYIEFSPIKITAPIAELIGSLHLDTTTFLIQGECNTNIKDLTYLESFHPQLQAEGTAFNRTQFIVEKASQAIKNTSSFSQLNIHDFHANNLQAQIDIDDIINNPLMDVTITMNGVHFRKIELSHLQFFSSNREENWPITLTMDGYWKDPLHLVLTGFWKYENKDYLLNIQELYGDMLTHAFAIPKPVQAELKENQFTLKDLIVELSNSKLSATFSIAKSEYDIRLNLDHFPIDFLSFNPLELSVTGYSNAQVLVKKDKGHTKGNISIDIDDVVIKALADKNPMIVNGSFKGWIDDEKLTLESQLKIRENEYLEMKGDLPLEISFFPFNIHTKNHKQFSSEILFDGKIEELLDFFNIGPHKLEADMKCNLSFSNTLSQPKITGFCTLENGIYENYYTGTYLQDVNLKLLAKNDRLLIDTFTAKDLEEGTINASGFVTMKLSKKLPYDIKVSLDNLSCIHTDLATVFATGEITLTGNMEKAKAKGSLNVTHADIYLPDKLPEVIPDLPVTFTGNRSSVAKITQSNFIPHKPFFPFALDINISADENVIIEGKGLDSKWKGNFHVDGTYSDIKAKGELELTKGVFIFSGREFQLTRGIVALTGQSQEVPTIQLTATTQIQGTTIFADLTGPINRSSLHFSSRPSLPESSIMALLIFGQDISELSGIQVLQLAAAMASFSDSANILEATRRTLGIDRLLIKTTPATEVDHPDQISVQVGKYITRGVLVSLSQGMDQGASNIIVEIDLKKGFVFQAETQQEEEQGKFTLKWSYNY